MYKLNLNFKNLKERRLRLRSQPLSNPQTGFTFIELLVVLAIIGILSTIIYASFGDSRISAQNNAFQVKLKEVQLAIETYKAQHGQYPPADTTCSGYSYFPPTQIHVSSGCSTGVVVDGLVPDFIDNFVTTADSANSACNIEYMVDDSGSWYKLTAKHCHQVTDGGQGVQLGDEMASCLKNCKANFCDASYTTNDYFYETYAIYSEGGSCRNNLP